MAVNVKYELHKRQVDLENAAFGSTLPPLGTELVYVMLVRSQGQLVQFFRYYPSAVENALISHTIETASSPTQASSLLLGCVR